jgi:group I intron endonuclease
VLVILEVLGEAGTVNSNVVEHKKNFYLELFPVEIKYNISTKAYLGMYGRKHTMEAIEKKQESVEKKQHFISDRLKEKLSIINKGENNSFFGKKHTPEALEKIQERRKNRGPVSEETKKK